MPALPNIPRAFSARFLALAAALVLAACTPTAGPGPGGGPRVQAGEPVPVALLVPGGGGNAGDAVVSRDLENAARLAIADLEGVAVDLRVYPTGGTAGGAQAAARQAADEGALILLGPLYAEAANAAGRTVAGDGLNVLAFSNNAAIAGGNVFVLGNTFDNVAGRLTAYAASQGKGDIFLVSAQTTAEEAGRDAVARAVGASRANLVGNLSFALNEAAIRGAAPRIAEQVRATGADSIFFTSGNAGAMAFLPQYLREQGISSQTTQFIGLTRLDIPPEALSQPGLQGAWFALPDPALQSNFRGRYAQAFGGQPHPLAGLAYDGIAAIGALAARGDALSRSSLTTGSGFVGVNGIFRLRADGTNERGLAVAQIRNNQVVVIDPAPRRFGGAGF
ncbi:penicillin-binding protein activator [Rhodovulum sp. 12E13]|uniref:ABC transporter substrate-binding protein n=1 Tax=Rhodovulum sp. 12E13 TaxID=2203891 RepID=UPI000E175126|nr:ABC transporter substrate-binding protein [Rhodovulum sp. 12E13]RDC74840.1 penicillin-binding protein activator [Rhodovulum sp. 12E13]